MQKRTKKALIIGCGSETLHFIFGKRAFFGYHVRSSGEVYWLANYVQAEGSAQEAAERTSSEELRSYLLDLFRDEQPFIRDIISGAETIFADFPTYILRKQPYWHKGPVVLTGDAAHAISSSSGQGASMALEDAEVLAKCLRDLPEMEAAFRRYEQLRRERTQKMLELGLNGDAGKHVSGGALRLWGRDVMTAFFLRLFGTQKSVSWIYSYKVDWDSPVVARELSVR